MNYCWQLCTQSPVELIKYLFFEDKSEALQEFDRLFGGEYQVRAGHIHLLLPVTRLNRTLTRYFPVQMWSFFRLWRCASLSASVQVSFSNLDRILHYIQYDLRDYMPIDHSITPWNLINLVDAITCYHLEECRYPELTITIEADRVSWGDHQLPFTQLPRYLPRLIQLFPPQINHSLLPVKLDYVFWKRYGMITDFVGRGTTEDRWVQVADQLTIQTDNLETLDYLQEIFEELRIDSRSGILSSGHAYLRVNPTEIYVGLWIRHQLRFRRHLSDQVLTLIFEYLK